MHQITDIVFFPDVLRLPKLTLKEICTDLMLETNGTVFDLSTRIWDTINAGNRELLERCNNRLLAGKTSVTWFKIENEGALRGFKAMLEGLPRNPFEHINEVLPRDVTSEPVLIAASVGHNDTDIYLRYMYNSGNRREVNGTNVQIVPKCEVATVFINQETDLIEVRTDSRNANNIASHIARMIGQQITLEQKKILAPYGNNVELIANVLQGELVDATSTPEFIFEDFNEQHTKAIIDILNALNTFFDEEDEAGLVQNLRQSSQFFGEHLLTTPFVALILNGMERVGLRVNEGDLRGRPLYDTLRPYLQHQGGFIKFNRPVNGVEKSFTVRVGLTSDSIYFTTPATEEVIEFVRNQVII
ncbi:hypothetical protein SK3146_03823 [Paenibacillus konkukensis]|uniref:Uncharacterized protein n=1 Tax=Paenibacillus konkukensis TaxID=2020716 RepID=A0ABY4RSQ4_9BACL|nr:hypothetical protein [Paenibacillus konkukensis]UQZ84568.1 hypothetical protein SK3146_03823 [Paenibacillus konkukensis]